MLSGKRRKRYLFRRFTGQSRTCRYLCATCLSYQYLYMKTHTDERLVLLEISGVKEQILTVDATSLTLQTGETTTIFPLQMLQTKKWKSFNR